MRPQHPQRPPSPPSPTPTRNRLRPRTMAHALGLLLVALQPLTATSATAPAPAAGAAGKTAAATVAAAEAFLTTLSDGQRQKVQFAFDDEAQRKKWSNLPSGIYQRNGLRLADLTKPQREAALAVLASALSKSGYQKVLGIMEGEEHLPKPGPDSKILFSRDEFFISFLGQPSLTRPWSIQFGGHHLALNLTLVGNQGTLAPSHTAAQPARFEWNGKTTRPLGRETDLSFELIQALDASQQKQAILNAKFRDLVLGPAVEYRQLAPEGVKVSTFNARQKDLLRQLIREWVGIANDTTAEPRMAEVERGLDETWFAWSGPTTTGSAAYFRIQGPTVFIEYAPQNLGGDPTQHIHTIYRDPTNEYGRKLRQP